jgi:acyl carrier protein
MSDAEIYQVLDGIFAQVFGRHVELKPELTAKDVPGWDSFRFISIIMAAEEHFHIQLPPAALDNLANVGHLVSAIAKQTA